LLETAFEKECLDWISQLRDALQRRNSFQRITRIAHRRTAKPSSLLAG
jgi:hypothetical protein